MRGPIAGVVAAAATAVALLLAGGPSAGAAGSVGTCQVFPDENHWNLPVDKLPVLKNSRDLVKSVGRGEEVHPDFGSGNYQGAPIGIPITVVGPNQSDVAIQYTEYGDESDPGPFPIPANADIEGGDDSDGDRHVIVVEQGTCVVYELYHAERPKGNETAWRAGSGADWDLSSNALRKPGFTSADAAGLPILPGLARFDEVQAGSIDHALRMTVPVSRDKYIYPATHFAGSGKSRKLPAMGQRFRLKAKVDPADFSPQAAVVVRALRTYGAIVADNGSPWFISGDPDDGLGQRRPPRAPRPDRPGLRRRRHDQTAAALTGL